MKFLVPRLYKELQQDNRLAVTLHITCEPHSAYARRSCGSPWLRLLLH